jgi:hypothetical protein
MSIALIDRITWTYRVNNSSSELLLTEGFYSTKEAAALFENAGSRYELSYDRGDSGYKFDIIISGAKFRLETVFFLFGKK